jgi:predicted GTPase
MKRVLILGAAGRDFHDFNVVFRNNPEFQVVAFTATQIPDIAGRRYPAELAGNLYPDGIPILEEDKMEQIIRDQHVDAVVFAYSDIAYPTLMHLASRAVAAGANFQLLAAARTQLTAKVPVVSVCAVRTGCGKSPVSRRIAVELRKQGWHPVVVRHPMPYGDLNEQRAQRFASWPISIATSAPLKSAKSTSRTSSKAPLSMPEWTMRTSCARRSWKEM